MNERGIFSKSIHGGKWLLMSVVANKVINLAPFFVLTRLLSPIDYGIINIAFLVSSLGDKLFNINFDQALIRKRGSIDEELATVWTFGLLRSAFIACLIFFLSGWVSVQLHVPSSYINIIRYSGLFLILSACANPQQTKLFRDLDMRPYFWRDFVAAIVYAVVSIGWAVFVSATVWALFIGYVARLLAGVFMTYFFVPIIPRIKWNVRHLLPHVRQGLLYYFQDLGSYLLSATDAFIVAHLFTVTDVGFFTRAQDTASMVSSSLLSVINKLAFSAYANLQTQLEKVRDGFLKNLDVFLMLSLPFCVLIILDGGEIVRILFGEKWLALVLPLKIFSFGTIFINISNSITPILNALGYARYVVKINAVQLCAMVIAVVFGAHFGGLIGSVIGVVCASIITFGIGFFKLNAVLKIDFSHYSAPIISGFAASLATVLASIFLRHYYFNSGSKILFVVLMSLLSSIYYSVLFITSYKLQAGPWFTLRKVFTEFIRLH